MIAEADLAQRLTARSHLGVIERAIRHLRQGWDILREMQRQTAACRWRSPPGNNRRKQPSRKTLGTNSLSFGTDPSDYWLATVAFSAIHLASTHASCAAKFRLKLRAPVK